MNIRKNRNGTALLTNALYDEGDGNLGLLLTANLMTLSIRRSKMMRLSTTTRRKNRRRLGNIRNATIAASRGHGIAAISIGGRLTLIAIMLISKELNLAGRNRSLLRVIGNRINSLINLLIDGNGTKLGILTGLYGLIILNDVRNSLRRDLLLILKSTLLRAGLLW